VDEPSPLWIAISLLLGPLLDYLLYQNLIISTAAMLGRDSTGSYVSSIFPRIFITIGGWCLFVYGLVADKNHVLGGIGLLLFAISVALSIYLGFRRSSSSR
jgi:hypothetical protein